MQSLGSLRSRPAVSGTPSRTVSENVRRAASESVPGPGGLWRRALLAHQRPGGGSERAASTQTAEARSPWNASADLAPVGQRRSAWLPLWLPVAGCIKDPAGHMASELDFCGALGGIRTLNLLIRSR